MIPDKSYLYSAAAAAAVAAKSLSHVRLCVTP